MSVLVDDFVLFFMMGVACAVCASLVCGICILPRECVISPC